MNTGKGKAGLWAEPSGTLVAMPGFPPASESLCNCALGLPLSKWQMSIMGGGGVGMGFKLLKDD